MPTTRFRVLIPLMVPKLTFICSVLAGNLAKRSILSPITLDFKTLWRYVAVWLNVLTDLRQMGLVGKLNSKRRRLRLKAAIKARCKSLPVWQ